MMELKPITFLIGLVFGATLSLGGASSHRMIINALRLKDLRLMKIIMTALAVGVLGVSLVDAAGMAHLKIKPLYLLGVAFGGVLFGIGFALAGYCPGTCIVATAERKKDAVFTLLGGVLGATTFGLLYPIIEPVFIKPINFGEVRVPDLLGVPPLAVAVLLAAVLLTAAWLLPDRINERKETTATQSQTKAA